MFVIHICHGERALSRPLPQTPKCLRIAQQRMTNDEQETFLESQCQFNEGLTSRKRLRGEQIIAVSHLIQSGVDRPFSVFPSRYHTNKLDGLDGISLAA